LLFEILNALRQVVGAKKKIGHHVAVDKKKLKK